mmetsp:Transcript_30303/g.50945  ORF Transcript_30303/g.50945 Transcript_30303/m.50945 type:complete len:362 (-) Transcript_30303:31-1116(-)
MVRSVEWHDGVVKLIDQRVLPHEFVVKDYTTVEDIAKAIKDMVVRGAPAIGVTGAFGMALAAKNFSGSSRDDLIKLLKTTKDTLDAARPTAVNLMWATARMVEVAETLPLKVQELKEALILEADCLAEEDVAINQRIGRFGASVIPDTANLIHHCNTGALATVDYGTALGIIFACHEQGKKIHVWVDETRPRLQGAKLTAWELMQKGIPMHLIADGAAGPLLRTGKVDAVVFGADRVTANGDVANKIGTYKLAVCARENGIPVYAAVPTSTIDLTLPHGDLIPIEERSADEVTTIGNTVVAPIGVPVFNPAFDVTPYKYLTGIVTEEGICYPPFTISLPRAVHAAAERVKAQRLERLKKPS